MSVCCLAHLGGCNGRIDPHHVLPQQAIKRKFPHGAMLVFETDGSTAFLLPLGRSAGMEADVSLADLLADRRNIVPVCRFHHEHLENRRIYLEPPENAWEFAVELGLSSVFEKSRERRAA